MRDKVVLENFQKVCFHIQEAISVGCKVQCWKSQKKWKNFTLLELHLPSLNFLILCDCENLQGAKIHVDRVKRT